MKNITTLAALKERLAKTRSGTSGWAANLSSCTKKANSKASPKAS
jgi:hypothetical protein